MPSKIVFDGFFSNLYYHSIEIFENDDNDVIRDNWWKTFRRHQYVNSDNHMLNLLHLLHLL